MLHMFSHSLHETWAMLPLLYLSYIFIELFENKRLNHVSIFRMLQKYGPLCGVIIGSIPQCGFSVIASILYLNRYITLGTLISVYIATSDEAILVFLSQPQLMKDLIGIVLIKLIVGCFVGYGVDYVLGKKDEIVTFHTLDKHEFSCSCCKSNKSIYLSAFYRTMKIFLFIVITTFILNVLIHESGEKFISIILSYKGAWGVLLSALIGFIPHCVTSVVLTQLYINGAISYAEIVAGLITNVGFGLLMLLKVGINKADFIRIMLILLTTALIVGAFLQCFYI